MDTADDMKLYVGSLHAHACAEACLIAHTIQNHAGRTSNHYIGSAVESLTKAADVLGFDLVKREPAKQSEAA